MNKLSVMVIFLLGISAATMILADVPFRGVTDLQRAEYNWVMKCQGCHKADATGTDGVPSIAGNVAKFLQLEEGRAYLAKVPGVSFVNLPDSEVAELLNWMVQRFDAQHIPANFFPYDSDEIKQLRSKPLISKVSTERRKLLLKINP